MTDRTIRELLNDGERHLKTSSDTPALDSQLLLGHVTGQPRTWLYTHDDERLDADAISRYTALLEDRRDGKPVAQVLGRQGFWQRDFRVTKDTLVPRPETELIVDTLLSRFDEAPRQVLDLGTGTGAIAISLAAERSHWQVTATDISAEALAVARDNAGNLTNLRFRQANWFEGDQACYDIIVSNPPYIPENDAHLEQLRFEPQLALVSGADGLDALREIIRAAPRHLHPNGSLMLEHGYDQQPAVMQLLDDAGFCDTEALTDLEGTPRAVLAKGPG